MTASPQLQLGNSLHAIHSAIHQNPNSTIDALPLFAVSRGSVYNRNTFLSVLIRIYYFVVRVVFRQPAPPPTEEALRLILNTFFDHMVTVAYAGRQKRITHYVRSVAGYSSQIQGQRYSEFIRGELHGSIRSDYHDFYLYKFNHGNQSLSELELKELNHASAAFVRHISAFWEKCVKGDVESDQFVSILRPYLEANNPSTLLDKPLYDALLKEEYWGYIEGLTSKRIPVDLLAKLHSPPTLTVDDRITLENWVAALNQNSHEISAQQLSTVIDEVAQIISIASSHPTTFADIVYWLHQNGCQAIDPNTHDDEYVNSNVGLWQPGASVSCSSENFTLGPVIQGNNDPSIFKTLEIIEKPGWVIKIPRNRFVYPIQMRERENRSSEWGFPYPKIIDFEPKRGFIIEERVSSFSDHQWTSSSMQLSREDLGYAYLFAHLIRNLNEARISIRGFTPSDIKLTSEGEGRFIRQFERGEASYQLLEEYCIQAAAGNPFILHYLMSESSLLNDPSADYYRDIVSQTFAGRIKNDNFLAPSNNEIDHSHAKSLHQQAKRIRAEAIDEVSGFSQYRGVSPQGISSMVSDRLCEFYLRSSTPGNFAIDFREQVVSSFKEKSSSTTSSD